MPANRKLARCRPTAVYLRVEVPAFPSSVASRQPRTAWRRPEARPSTPALRLGQRTHLIPRGWLADDAQLGEDVPAGGAATVLSARRHPVVATPGADAKEAAGWSGAVLWRGGVGRRAVVARSGWAGRPAPVRILDDSTAQTHQRHLLAACSAGKLRRCWRAPPGAGPVSSAGPPGRHPGR
jgi:hypothetical protein